MRVGVSLVSDHRTAAAAAAAARSTSVDVISRSRRRVSDPRTRTALRRLAAEQRLQLVAKVLVHERVDERVGDVVDEVQVEHEDVIRYHAQRNQRRR